MSTQSKIDRQLYGPSLMEVTLGALLSLLLGAVLAAGYLLFKPVETVRVLPADEDRPRDQIYYIEGSRNGSNARQWMRKRQLLVEGQPAEILLIEDELNVWLADGPKPPAEGTDFIEAPSVNVRIRDGVLQIGAPGRLNAFGYSHPVVLQARGGFERDDKGYTFDPTEVYAGSLPLHRIPFAENYLMNRLLAAQAIPEELTAAWGRVSELEVVDNTLRIVQQ